MQRSGACVLLGGERERFGELLAPALRLYVPGSHALGQNLAAGIEPLQLAPRGLERGLYLAVLPLGNARLGAQGVQVVHPEADLGYAQLVAQGEETLRHLRLLAQRVHLQLELLYLVVYAEQVLLSALQPALGLLLAVAVAGDTRGLLEHLSALGALSAHNLGNAPLSDYGIAVASHAGVHQQLVHVAQAHLAAVDIVLALTGAIVLARNRDLVGVYVEKPRRVIQHERHLSDAQARPPGRSAEDDVLHLAAAQSTGALLAHDPEYGVGNIRFARAVGADYGGYIPPEGQTRPLGEALESGNLQCLQIQF